jgi:heterodisulfide reductase subunit A-like polyferredoxin
MEISEPVQALGRRLGVELDAYGFCHTIQFNPVETSRKGIFAVGPFREPKDIPESVVEASGAAAAAAAQLSSARFQATTSKEYPPEVDHSLEDARVGVFVCHCGSNIGGYLDVPDVTEYAGSLPGVVHAEANLYTCSQDSIRHITETVQEKGLNRVVVASCTPLTHQPLFQDSLRAAGLNPFLFEMANIRNQCSWVHSTDHQAATQKARELVHMAVARSARLEAQNVIQVPVNKNALVVGGGPAGMTAALNLADQGFPVHLVEKLGKLGGNLKNAFLPSNGTDPQAVMHQLIDRVHQHPQIYLHLGCEVKASSGFKGNFSSRLVNASGKEIEIGHGATIIAVGGQEYEGPEYGYGQHPHVITMREFGERLEACDIEKVDSVGVVLCVGPAGDYCSRICCTLALKNALELKQRKPAAEVVFFYKDIRVYGLREDLYTRARKAGILFVRYTDEQPPEVRLDPEIEVKVLDRTLGREIRFNPDLLVLSMPVIPRAGSEKVANRFKVPLDANGFFLEAHVKLRPVDTTTDGVFIAGMAHYPKLLDETLIQAQAAAARAARVLSQDYLTAGGRVAVVDQERCTGCLTCVRICPFDVPKIQPEAVGVGGILGAAFIEAAVCQGCGNCVSECPAQAIQLMHYTDEQVEAKIEALAQTTAVIIPTEQVLGALT